MFAHQKTDDDTTYPQGDNGYEYVRISPKHILQDTVLGCGYRQLDTILYVEIFHQHS